MNTSNAVGGGCQGDGSHIVTNNPPLRIPKEETVARIRNGVVGSDTNGPNAIGSRSFANIVKANKPLSATAETFVPRGNTFQNVPPLSANASVFVPRQQPSDQNEDDSHIYNSVMQEFNKTVAILITQPGNMEEYMNRLCEHLVPVQCNNTLNSIIEYLYDQCINEGNFRYTGARVCQHLSISLKNHPVFKNFRKHLLNRCKKDFEQRESLIANNQSSEVYGFAMFVSELFLNLEIPADCETENSRKFDILAICIKEIILSLLAHPSKDNIKCAVQMLKLAGASVEEVLFSKNQSLDDVFSSLSHLQTTSDVHENAKIMIKSVEDLRANNWGRGDSVSSTEGLTNDMNHMNLSYSMLESEPVFYNTEGQTISRTEAGCQFEVEEEADYLLNEEEDLDYLQWQQESGTTDMNSHQYAPWSYDEAYSSVQVDDPEYTTEVMDAYEDFLKTSR